MFDELHDPDPPAITGRHLAEVAERAAGLRRRRNTIVGGVAAVVLLAAGAVGVAATNRAGSTQIDVADAPLPTVAVESADEGGAPTTTVLDPASLPPAVPVNPDPEDLPPAVPLNTDPDASPSEGEPSGTTNESGDASDGTDADDGDAPPEGDDAFTTDDEPILDAATAAALRADEPILAITSSGAAVWFPSVDADSDPITVADGVDGLDFLAEGSAIALRGISLELIDLEGSVADEYFGALAATVDPTGTSIAIVDTDGTLAVTSPSVDDRSIGTPIELISDRPDAAGTDVLWTASTGLIALASTGDGAALSIVRAVPAESEAVVVDGAITTLALPDVTGIDLRLAGVDTAGRVVLHDAGTERLFAATLDGAVTETELDAPARSVWVDGAEVIIVTVDGTLIDMVDSAITTLPGTYLAARR